MDVEFFSFDKKRNSLKTPDSPGTVVQGVLKEPCSVLTPSVYFRFDPEQFTGDKYAYTYAEIPAFGRYYFVKNWTAEGGRWRCDMIVDVLASYRQSILDSTQYVERSASATDGDIIDNLYPAKAGYTVVTNEIAAGELFEKTWSDGLYIVGIAGGASSLGVSYYQFTPEAFFTFCQWLSNESDASGLIATMSIDDISKALTRALVNPFEYIVSCQWFPFEFNVGSTVASVKYSYWEYTVPTSGSVRLWNGAVFSRIVSMSVPKHPNVANHPWLKSSPYSTYELYFPPFGEITIDPAMLYKRSHLVIKMDIDIATGQAHAAIYANSTGEVGGDLIDLYDAKVGVEIPLSGRTFNASLQDLSTIALSQIGGSAAADIARGAKGMLSWIGIDGQTVDSFAALFETVGNGAAASVSQMTKIGTMGNFAIYQQPTRLSLRYLKIVETNNDDYGSPYCKRVVLRTLSGFTKCQNSDITLTGGLLSEVSEVNHFLDSGVFIE